MKKLLFVLSLILAFEISFGAQYEHKTVNSQQIQTKESVVKLKLPFKSLNSDESNTVVLGRYAMLGIALFLIGVLILVLPSTVIEIVAYTLIVMGVVFFVLDIAKII